MIYVLVYEIEGIFGRGGSVSADSQEIVECAANLSKIALDHIGDEAQEFEWYDIAGNQKDPLKILGSAQSDEILHMVGQVSDLLKAKNLGHMDFV